MRITTGDGNLDVVVQSKPDDFGVRRALVTLRGTKSSGGPLTYAVRLHDEGSGWTWAASGSVTGKLGRTKLQVIDLNRNGCYDDVGVDDHVRPLIIR